MAQSNISVPEITKRFGVVSRGTPQLINTIGTTILYTPTPGYQVRLKWFGMASPDTNTQTVIATVTLGTDIYIWPLGAPGAFMHASVREGNADVALSISLSTGGQDVYVNMDIEEFDQTY